MIKYPLVTCSVREYRARMGVAIPITLAAEGVIPRERPVRLLYPDTGKHDVMDVATQQEFYRRQLAKLQTAKVAAAIDTAMINAGAAAMPDRPAVLLCVCWLGNPAVVCHRRLFATWWQTRTGQIVPELGDTPLALWGDDASVQEPAIPAGGRHLGPA